MAPTVTLDSTALLTAKEAEEFVWDDKSERNDEEKDVLYRIVNSVSAAIVRLIGPVVEVAVTKEQHDGGSSRLWLRNHPIRSVDSVEEDGDELTEDEDFLVYGDEGYLLRINEDLSTKTPKRWHREPRQIEVTYKAGRCEDTDSVPADLKMAASLWCFQVWHAVQGNRSNLTTQVERGWLGAPPDNVQKILDAYRQVHLA